MPRKSNGLGSRGGYKRLPQAPLSAIQELIGAIHYGQAEVSRFALGDYDLYLFAIKRHLQPINTSQQGDTRTATYARLSIPAAFTGPQRAVLENIIDCACRIAKVTRADLASKLKAKPISFARALIAHQATLSKTASYSQVASMLKVHVNSLHLSIRRYRQAVPQYFETSLEQLLALNEKAQIELVTIMGEPWAKAKSTVPSSDAEIGNRIAHTLASD